MAPVAPIFAQEEALSVSRSEITSVLLGEESNDQSFDTKKELDNSVIENTDKENSNIESEIQPEPQAMSSSASPVGGFLGDTRDLPNIALPQIDKDPNNSALRIDQVLMKVYYRTPAQTIPSVLEYIHTDHLNSTNLSTDESGTVISLLDYYPYGSSRIEEGSSINNRKFIGQEYDEDTQLSYLNARYYNGARGQFISQDPEFWVTSLDWLLDPQNQNSYAYARNNPITLSDPTGRSVYAVSKEIENNSAGTHVFLLIAPNNPGDFGMKSGDAWTLGGYAGDNGNLIKGRNAPSDVSVVQNGYSMPDQQKGKMKSTVQVQMPSGVSDTEFIKNITNQYNAYNEDAAYDPFVNNGYNSNNFATTLLRGAGVENLPWNGNAPGIDPGYGQSIPSNYVKANGTMGAANLSAVSNYGSRETGRQVGGAINRATQAVSNGVRTIINKIKGN